MLNANETAKDVNEIAADIKEKDWPVVFKVCKEHKEQFFAGYKQAEIGRKDQCVLCHPTDNDALGG